MRESLVLSWEEVRSVRVNIVLMQYRKHVCRIIHPENRHFSMSQIMISDRFSYRYQIIAFYGALNGLDYCEVSRPEEFHLQHRVAGPVSRYLLPHNVACRFPALRSSEDGSQNCKSLQLCI